MTGQEDGVSAEETEQPVLRGPPATPRTPARRGRRAKAGRELNQRSLADGYFSAHSEKVLTSDHTLARLNTPRLCDTEVTKLLRGARPQYESEVRELLADHRVQVLQSTNLEVKSTSYLTIICSFPNGGRFYSGDSLSSATGSAARKVSCTLSTRNFYWRR